MRITVVNMSGMEDESVLPVLRAINRQILEDFSPYCGQHATLRLEGRATTRPEHQKPPKLRGDAILYLWNEPDVEGALGYHDENSIGLPVGFVFTELSDQLGESWTVTLSHEALEIIGDANVNKLASGPHPGDPDKSVLHWYEMCDAVQAEIYEIDGVAVSNFVLPLYLTPGEQVGGRNDFLGRSYDGKTLASFGVNPGGYVGFLNPETNDMETWSAPDDEEAVRRLKVKAKAGMTRRSVRKANLPQLAVEPDLKRAKVVQSIVPSARR
jgi:hypothetical protein